MPDYQNIFAAARTAQKTWAKKPFSERARHITGMRDFIVANPDRLVDVVVAATGKTRVDALTTEVVPCALACRWYAENAQRMLAPDRLKTSTILFAHKKSEVIRVPLGVVGIISPWNYPLSIPFGEIVMGLMAGNAILLKVASNIPTIGTLIEEIVQHGRLPDGLFAHVSGAGAQVADAFFGNRVDKIFFTGSVGAGKDLMRKAAETLTPLSLELGGNDPMLVLADADLERATNGAAWGGYQNAGQTCGGVERIYVDEKVYEPFVQLLARKTRSLRHGRDTNFEVDVGTMTTAAQLKKVTEHVDDALQKGAKIVAQSHCVGSDTLCYPATLLTEVNHSMLVMQDETFGPVLGVMPFKTIDEAVSLANDSQLALTSSVWTRDTQLGLMIARQIEAGVTTINDHVYTHALSETPWGGWKESGIGRTHGRYGLEEMTHAKVINWDRLSTKRNLFWYPFDKATYDGIKSALSFCFPRSSGEYLASMAKLGPFVAKKMFTPWDVK